MGIAMKKEIWKAIPDYQGYEVSNLGRIRTNNKVTHSALGERHWKNRVLKLKTDRDGYKRVSLWANGKNKDWLVHRIVASVFLERIVNKNIINHIDCNPSNNSVDNLEWTDYRGNLMHAYKHGLNKEPNKVVLLNINNGEMHHFISYSMASLFLHRNKSYLSHALQRGKNVVDGYEVYKLV